MVRTKKIKDMVRVFYLVLLFSLSALMDSWAQESAGTDAAWIAPGEELMHTGSYYYPEHWPEKDWAKAFQKMADAGLTFTHFGEFAWAQMEPVEGQYEFDWLDRAIAAADQAGLKVILCTPSPTPPAWLTQKYSEILVVDQQGIRKQHGTRQHASWSSSTYRDYVRLIVQKLAECYGEDERVIGWQIDNEPSHYGQYDYSKAAQNHFRQWLKQRYSKIDQLNEAWGNAFWGQRYQNFEQIRIPNQAELPASVNPHALLDYKRFHAQSCADFVCMQAEVLRESIKENQFITTNYMGWHPPIDNRRTAPCLDFTSYTIYPASNPGGAEEMASRIGDPAYLIWSQTLAESANGKTGCMEIQVGQVNWGAYNAQPLPGAVSTYLWHTFALGDRFVCNYRFDKPTYGSELYFQGILAPDQETVNLPGGQEYLDFVDDLKAFRKLAQADAEEPKSWQQRKTAMVFKQDNIWDIENHKQTQFWNNTEHLYNYVRALQACAAPMEIIPEQSNWNPYPYLILPAYQLADEGILRRIRTYAKQGGHVLITPRSLTKDTMGIFPEAPYGDRISALMGMGPMEFDNVLPGKDGEVQFQGKHYHWQVWGEYFKKAASTEDQQNVAEVWAEHTVFFYRNRPAILHRKLGQGSITYNGIYTQEGDLEEDLVRHWMQVNGGAPQDVPEGVYLAYRAGWYFAFNYGKDTQELDLGVAVEFFKGDKDIASGEVVIWREQQK